jgi:hypothetical protein
MQYMVWRVLFTLLWIGTSHNDAHVEPLLARKCVVDIHINNILIHIRRKTDYPGDRVICITLILPRQYMITSPFYFQLKWIGSQNDANAESQLARRFRLYILIMCSFLSG